MTGEPLRGSPELDPVVRAVAEARAREAGQSVSDYLTHLILTPHHGGLAGEATTVVPELNLWKRPSVFISSSGGLSLYGSSEEDWSRPPIGPTSWSATSASATPALQLVMVFNNRIHGAAVLMSAAFLEAAVSDFKVPITRRGTARHHSPSSWYEQVISTCVVRSLEVRNALVHRWQPTARAERLATDAFVLLTDLTPARTELLQLCRYDRPRAFTELAKHLELLTDQFRLSAHLLAEVEGKERPAALAGEQRFAEISAELLERAGGGMSLTNGAKLLGTTRQALHKRVKAGSALGMMQGTELVLPRLQFESADGRTHLIDGLSQIVRLFDESKAGRWSALQFLIEQDPNLGNAPIRFLSEGRVDDVVNAARAYLGFEER
jgi:hypothetical protein